MEIVILSVPHTGTNLAKRLFRDRGWEDVALNTSAEQQNAYYVGHIREDDMFRRGLELAKVRPLVCPLRHPFRVEESWRRRKKPRPISQMVEGFRLMMDLLLPLRPYILPVDSRKRDACLKALSKGLGVALETDWPVMGTTGTHLLELEDCNPSDAVVKLVEDMAPFLKKFY